MIDFSNILIQGFGSIIQQTKFKLNREGLSIIRGRVGSGKTSVPSALVWCIYGETLKKKSTVETWEELRPEDYKGTKVEVNFTKGSKYRIIRCLNYKGKIEKIKGGNNLFIFKDGELLKHKRNKGDKQKYICDLIGYSHSLFINSIVFGQRMKKIIEESGPVKKKIFEEAFEVTFIEEAKKATKANLDKTVSLISKHNLKVEDLNEKIDELKEDIQEALDDEKEFKNNKKTRLKKLKQTLREHQTDKLKIEQKIEAIEIHDVDALKKANIKLNKDIKKVKDHNRDRQDLADEIKGIEDEETELYNQPDGDIKICPTCGGKLSFKKSKKLTKERGDKIKALGKKADKKRDKLMTMKTLKKGKLEKEVEGNIEKINNTRVNKALEKVNSELLIKAKSNIQDTKDEIAEVRLEKLIVRSKKLEKRLTKNKVELEDINSELAILKGSREIEDWLIKDPLSNTGLKAYIFDNLLGRVNSYLADYSKILGFRVEFGIDLESTRKDFFQSITRDDILIMYEDLSGGQKQLVDTSVALAIHSVIAAIRPVNILFMDEPFEGLDEETVETVAELIDYKCKQQCLYLITHHSSFNPINAKEIKMKLNPEGHTIVL